MAGRPTKYKPEYAVEVAKLCKLGATDAEIADFFDVTVVTVWRWQSAHPEFCNALKAGKKEADARVERSLFQRAVGYTFDAVHFSAWQGAVTETEYRNHVPPDPTSCIFWLKNRKPAEWRDRVLGDPDNPINVVGKLIWQPPESAKS